MADRIDWDRVNRKYDREEVEHMMRQLINQLFEGELRDDEIERWSEYYAPLKTDGKGNYWCDEASVKLTEMIDHIIDTINVVQDWNLLDPPQ